MISVKCNFCDNSILKYKSAIKKHNFCNKKCESLWLKENRNGSLNPFFGKKHTKETKEKIIKKLKNLVIVHKENCQCLVCKSKRGESHKIDCKCCSCSSQRGEYYKDKNGRWNNGSSFEPYPLEWNETFKERIRYRDGYKCKNCGIPEAECKTKLHVHHIDYDKQNLNINNLISLCTKCHTRTNGNRKYWIKYFKEN